MHRSAALSSDEELPIAPQGGRGLTPPLIPPIPSTSSPFTNSDVVGGQQQQTKRVRLTFSTRDQEDEDENSPIGPGNVADLHSDTHLVSFVAGARGTPTASGPIPGAATAAMAAEQGVFSLAPERPPSVLTKAYGRDPFAFIDYLKKHPKTKEFAYMNPMKTSLRRGQPVFNPYRLEIVDYADADKEGGYYTISREGVTHFDKFGHGEFTPLDSWLREHKLFHELLRIPFFAKYRLWKCFTLWRRTVLHTKILLAKKSLNKNLFILHPVLRDALIGIRSRSVSIMTHRRLMRIQEGKSYELGDFVTEQTNHVDDISKNFLSTWEQEVRDLVEEAGIVCLKEKGFEVERTQPDANGGGDGTGDGDVKPNSGDSALLGKGSESKMHLVMAPAPATASSAGTNSTSNDQPNQPKKLSFTEQAARRTECKRLQRFVKLSDYIIVSTLHMLVVESVRDLLKVTFRGCTDVDVIVDRQGNSGTLLISENGAITNHDPFLLHSALGASGQGEGDQAARDDGNRGDSATLSSGQNQQHHQQGDEGLDGTGFSGSVGGNANAVQVGGVVVGPEVETSGLIHNGFDGFPAILSRLAKSHMLKIELVEVIEEEGPAWVGGGGDASSEPMDTDMPQMDSTSKGPIKDGGKTAGAGGQNASKDASKPRPLVPLFKIELLLLHQQQQQQNGNVSGNDNNNISKANGLFANTKLTFTPAMFDFLLAVDMLLKLYIATSEKVKLLTNTIPYLDPANLQGGAYSATRGLEESDFTEGPPNVGSIITDGAYFREVCGRLRGVIVGNFVNAVNWMKTLEEVHMMWGENEEFDAMKALETAGGPVAMLFANNNSGGNSNGSNSNGISNNSNSNGGNSSGNGGGGAGTSGSQHGGEGGVAALLIAYAERERQKKLAEEAATSGGNPAPQNYQSTSVLHIGSTIKTREDGSVFSPLVDFFEHYLSKFSQQRATMNAITTSVAINNLLIDTSKLKNILVPSPERCFQQVARMLPGIARDKNELLLTEVQTWVRVLNAQPQNVEAFVEYLGWLERVRDSMTLVDNLYDEVTRLYSLMEQHKIPIQPTDLALYQTLGPTLRQLKESVDMASETKDENISKFSAELDKAMSELMGEVGEIRNKAQDPIILNLNMPITAPAATTPGSTAAAAGGKQQSQVVVKMLDELRDQLGKIEVLKTKYEMWGELFRNGGVGVATLQNRLAAVTADGGKAGQSQQQQQQQKGDGSGKLGELEETKMEVELKRTLWISLREWENITERWKTLQFESLNPEEVNAQITSYMKTVYVLDKGLPPNDVVPKLKAMVEEYKVIYPTILDLRNPALKPRHWEKIQDAIGTFLVRDETFTLGKLMELRVFDYKEEIGNISSQAGSEAALEEMLTKVVKAWNEAEFILAPYRDAKDVFILGTVEDIQTLLEDSQVTLATIKGSRFIGPIKPEVEKWDKMLSLFADTLDAWLTCQRNWLYLESIFSAPDIQRQLPDEARMFAQVDRSWKDIMRKVYRNPNAMKSGTTPGVLETMQQNNVLLEQIQKCLEDYLESKRLLFPRFYFLSNEELLEILSQTRNPQAVQPHLSKCFDAIKSLEFSSAGAATNTTASSSAPATGTAAAASSGGAPPTNSDPKNIDIIAMISPEGERVPFVKPIKARGNVEVWLGNVEEAMVAVLRRFVKIALGEYEEAKRSDWVREHTGQVVVTGNQVLWCRDVHECLKANDPGKALVALKQKWVTNLSQLAALVRGDLTKIQRAILGALITIDVHNRDIIQGLITAKTSSPSDFEWTKQLRYYWDMDGDTCHVKMSTSVFNYGYEYLGCSPRLVITPLTDRCYLTLTGALQLNLGGSPVGPAGTGKTETVKDLAKALARQCVVFNCSDGMNYQMMGKMFAGLAQSGAWCCFDEFNRIDIEVLSVIAQQLLTIKNAKDMKAVKFMFEGREIRLIDTCAAFITMNPGYAGRTELPDNLKALFRPIAMMIPDYGLIAEIILFSEGFENAKLFSGKVVNLYKLCSEQLSQQDHYDFGMRAVKSVLIMAGALKRSQPELSEEVVLIRSLRDSNLPKFLAEDISLFRGILQDLFPGVTVVEQDFGHFVKVIKEVLEERSLEVVDAFVQRILQLWETTRIRHGVMLVGPTGGGKTTCYEVLKETATRLRERGHPNSDFQKVKTWVLNPKCVTMPELYGEFNKATMEWRDGLIGSIFRAQVADTTPDEKWTVCDGPVDALWIENMNTVLDDNKLLTLINSERIKMNSTMHMLFEVADLAVASPATVSRCGMVYMDPSNLGWRSYVKSWLRKLPAHVPEELKDTFWQHFDTYVDKGLRFIRKQCKEFIKSVDLNLVSSVCKLLTTFINRTSDIDFSGSNAHGGGHGLASLKALFGHLFVFCYVWGLGGNLADGFQDKFDTFVRDMFETMNIPDVQIPSSNNVFCYYVDLKTRNFALWDDLVPSFHYSSDVPYFQMIVPTADTVKYTYFLEALLTNGYPTLFTGSTGVGKSVIVQDLLSKMSKSNGYVPVILNFSAQTNSAMTQQYMELKLEKKRKNILGAPSGASKVVLFVDDLNMPKMDTYGSQPPIELLRQYLDFGGFYDREKLFWKVVQDLDIVAACAPPGGGRNVVTPRLIRHFTLLNIPAPSELSLGKIFRSIVDGFLKPFMSEIKALSDAIVNSSIEIYNRMCTELLPTPAKSHYTFNLRDLSKVIQGILQVRPIAIQTKNDMARLFCHEASRIFHDRLIDETDRNYFFDLLSTLTEKNFGVQITKETFITKPIMFGHFGKRGVPVEERPYVEMADMTVLNNILEEYLEEYNVTLSKDVRLIFFLDAKQHITRISRILRQPRGNALLVGVGGTGKQSLTRLACFISEYQCHQIELTRTYGETEWREDIKKMYRIAGVEGKNTVFLLSDTQIKSEIFLEDINNILNSGEVPNLFDFDERERILGELRQVAREKGLPEDRDTVSQFFINRVRDNLHIVFATSPVGDTFRNRCRMFPSLVNCCTIDWFDEWPRDALLSVSQRFFTNVDLGSDEMRANIAEACVDVHASVGVMAKKFYAELRRRYYTTPTSYLELINLYVSMLHEKRKELGASRDRLRNGLNKLTETNELVAKMQIELEQLGPELKQRAQDVETLMVKIAQDQETADGVRRVVMEEETVVRAKATETEAIAAEAQKDLDEALPALQAAYKALDALEKKDIAELKVFSKPPDLVLLVMEAICILFKVKPDWESSKKLLSDPQLMKKMAEYDKDNIPESISKKLRKYIENPNFNPEAVEKVAKACKSMVMWVIALDIYSRVFKEVQPKRKRLEEAQQALEATRAKLAEKTAALQEVEAQLNKLKTKYETSVASKKQLSEKMEETTKRLTRASKLTAALADEQIRWSDSVQKLNEQIDALVGNIFLSAACIAYYGAFTSNYRQELVATWKRRCTEIGIPVSEKFSLFDNLADPAVVRDWNIQGLPADPLSIDNGILVTRGRRWPLMIDPQSQANRWIRSMEGNELKVIKLTEPKFLRSLENAIRTGQAVLLEDVGEQLDPALEPLLLKQTVRQGGRLLIKLGDTFVEYDKNFKLYITTKLSNPHYLPEVCIKVTIINFTVTKMGLEGQLLADVVKLERPELEEQRNSLIVNIANDKKQLKDIEEKILKLLFNSQGTILDDEELINTLNQSKVTSAAIKERVAQAEQTEQDINAAREKYRPVAIRGSVLYFVIADLAEIDPMYQFSLKYFKNLFNLCIKDSEKAENLQQRIDILRKNITYTTFLNISRGLFEQHKLIFSFMICVEVLRERGDITDDEWNFFLRGGAGMLAKDLPPRPNAKWLTSSMWQVCFQLAESIPHFSYMMEHMIMYTMEWERIIESDVPYLESVPGVTADQISDFQRLLLVKVMREEKLVPSAVEFIKRNLGPEYIDTPPLDLAKAYKDTSAQAPLIFILSTGSDPVSALMKFAASKEMNMQERLHMISLGQGQGPIAEELLRKATASGDWVFLQNCHLAASWMNRLETLVKDLSTPEADVNPNFRLFLSSMPSKVFPTAVLQDGVKVTNEPPKGLRANLARSFADVSRDLFDDHPPQGVVFRKLLFGVCFFNAVIHERKKFGPLGWNISYDWSNSDLEVSMIILRNMLFDNIGKPLPWDALTYLTGEITFGGRVTDDWDRRTLRTILAKYYTPKILEDAYRFSPSGVYYAPSDGEIASFRTYIDSLPYEEEPSVFGMHENANISFQMQETRRLIRSVLDVQPRLVSMGAGGKSSEEVAIEVASSILESWPEPLILELPPAPSASERARTPARPGSGSSSDISNPVLEELFRKDSSGRMINSLSTVLSQEAVRFNKLLAIVKASLESLIKAVRGLVVMSSELERVFTSLLNNEVPVAWSTVAYPSLKPLASWVKDLQLRIAFLRDWAFSGQPDSFWLSGFFFPQGFLTGVLQNHARKYNIPIDSLSFVYQVTDLIEDNSNTPTDESRPTTAHSKRMSVMTSTRNSMVAHHDDGHNPEDGVFVRGLFMEGARWDHEKRSIQNSFPMEMFSVMPLIRFIPTQIPQLDHQKFYVCPLYKTSARAERGVALLLNE
ncbi:Dynein heavy chain 6, axonemal [Quaeritorhiza haematococci]|nr:Dynein heavy chain 6, axonemal [Quaeritorhiza haematococci]